MMTALYRRYHYLVMQFYYILKFSLHIFHRLLHTLKFLL